MNPDLPTAPNPAAAPVRHRVVDGPATSLLLRDGEVAANVLLTAGAAPRLLMAFAAGNSGAALWFAAGRSATHWRAVSEPVAVHEADPRRRPLRGVELELEADVEVLTVRQALLGSVRVLRDHQGDGRLPPHGLVAAAVRGDGVRWARDRLDGAAGYALDVRVPGGRVELDAAGQVTLRAAPGSATLRLTLRALTGDPPLTPLHAHELLHAPAAAPPSALQSLLFLSYREALFAGSWRFHTYFGRDTLMTLRLLMPALEPTAIEAALATVLVRLSPRGEVAHEEDVGECAILARLARGEPANAEPIFDYKMVDDDFMLLPVAAAYLLDTYPGQARARAFLAERDAQGTPFGALLMRNAAWVMARAQAFAKQPSVETLIALKPGEVVGDWRDSGDGLGGGTYAYSVNVALVPAALRAIAAFQESGLLAAYSPECADVAPSQAAAFASVWAEHAPPLFEHRIARAQAAQAVSRHARELATPDVGLPDGDLVFSAIALGADGKHVPVMHSDFGFELLFGQPDAQRLELEVANLTRRFPAGLMTEAGMLVANAAHGDAALRTMFGADRYHGAVVWSWQQALVAAGLARQRARIDLPQHTQALLGSAETALWAVIHATREVADGELWSWAHVDGRDEVRSFGPLSATADESNAVQLWSTVYIAVQAPAA